MKLFTLIVLSVFLSKSCEGQNKNDLKTAVLEYTANTRGFYQKITIQDQMVSISKDRSGNNKAAATKISDKDWKELVGYFESFELDKIATLKAPTEKRFYDGAAIANLKIIIKDKTYETESFDHGYPPVEIKKLVDKINTFAKKNNEN
jgi:phosphorylcholine metabolism protein LicD